MIPCNEQACTAAGRACWTQGVPGSSWAGWAERSVAATPHSPLSAVGPGSQNPPKNHRKIAVCLQDLLGQHTDIYRNIYRFSQIDTSCADFDGEKPSRVAVDCFSLSTLPRPSTSTLNHQPAQSRSQTHGQPTPTPRPSRR